MSELPLTGGCNCGAVRFEVTAPLAVASYCHCKRCQRRSGAAASANAHPAPGTFRIVAGEDRLRVMGAFDDDPGIRPSVRQFVAYAASWEPIPDDGMPRHPESRHNLR